MAPEYGATMGFFPVDEETINYLLLTARNKEHVDFVEKYCKTQGLFYDDHNVVRYNKIIELDMGEVERSIAGPKRPHDRISLSKLEGNFHEVLKKQGSLKNHLEQDFDRFLDEGGGQETQPIENIQKRKSKQKENIKITHGCVVIAAITSCTNTSNPQVMIGAGLLAKKAYEKGEYLNAAGLTQYLESLGFYLVGYGCTTCIGNSGPISFEIANEINQKNLTVAAVLSGNRNFEGRIHQLVKANYIASPPLVVAYAIAGSVDVDLENEPLGFDKDKKEVYLKDIWPQQNEIDELLKKTVNKKMFKTQYSEIFTGTNLWNELDVPNKDLYFWDEKSTYIKEPPFFIDFPLASIECEDIVDARVLALLGDSITTDHISPAGAIPQDGPAGQYLISKGVEPSNFNSFGSRRGNHEVMIRGTFANIRLRNLLVPKREGGWTMYLPTGEEMTIYKAAMQYMKEGIPTIIMAGKEYGTGSSRDWAAKGTYLLGVKAVIAQSYERIHRSNLVGMGVLPLQFQEGMGASSLGLKGDEAYHILGIKEMEPKGILKVIVKDQEKEKTTFEATVMLDSDVEIENFRNGGILHKFLRDSLNKNKIQS
jgi:aconitate hydratase